MYSKLKKMLTDTLKLKTNIKVKSIYFNKGII